MEDDEPKYGLSVSGLVHPDRIMRNSSLTPGDKIILTKAVGTGVIATAVKGGLASAESLDAMVNSLITTNRKACEVGARFGVRACTDVTGFGLAGHLAEMARASGCRVRMRSEAVPLLEGAEESASMGLVPGGAHANRKFFGCWTDLDRGLSDVMTDLMFDPQTSGGLLLAIRSEKADDLMSALIAEGVGPSADIGEVLEINPGGRVEIV